MSILDRRNIMAFIVSNSTPVMTAADFFRLDAARGAGSNELKISVDLQRSESTVQLKRSHWHYDHRDYPYAERPKERTIYHWADGGFQPVMRYTAALVKLIPTRWGAPTFEIDGIKMLPSAQISPFADAKQKVSFIRPAGKVILDTCAGLGYFAHWCIVGGARRVLSYEKNADVLWLRGINPWSPLPHPAVELACEEVQDAVNRERSETFDAILHDPPRFSIAGELYSEEFYRQLARVLRRSGQLFHYTGRPNSRSRDRDLATEVAQRLMRCGFTMVFRGDGLIATKIR